MEQCVDEGLIRSIGLSNFNSQQLQYIIDHGRVKPAVLQVTSATASHRCNCMSEEEDSL